MNLAMLVGGGGESDHMEYPEVTLTANSTQPTYASTVGFDPRSH